MADKSKEWTISCSWAHISSDDLKKTCQHTNDDAGLGDLDVDEITSLDFCLCLKREEALGPPEITITTKSVLKRVDLVSESRLIEVFRGGGEYLSTCTADFVDDWEDMAVYYTKILVPTPDRSLSLKFSRLKYEDRLWIYGIRIQTTTASEENGATFHFRSLLNPKGEVSPAMVAFAQKMKEVSRESTETLTSETECEDCRKCAQTFEDMEQKLNQKLSQIEENIKTEITRQNEELLKNIRDLLISSNLIKDEV